MVGECSLGIEEVNDTPFFDKSLDSPTYPFLMILNCSDQHRRLNRSPLSKMEVRQPEPRPEVVKVLNLPISESEQDPFFCNEVLSVGYGPFDNGYVCLGTSSGHLLLYDPVTLGRISCQQIFESGSVVSLSFEPLNCLLAASSSGEVAIFNPFH